ncbi:MAG: response regulator [Burkholderiales bacterium]|nr:response regulator [Burkholderiales bacterium]
MTETKRLLLIEDSPHKRAKVVEHIKALYPQIHIREAGSFASGCRAVDACEYDVLLIDMSLPTYDKSPAAAAGKFRPFGGREIARKIVRRGLRTPLIFITQFESFSDRGNSFSFDTLMEKLREECGAAFVGMLFYDSSKTSWKDELGELLHAALYEDTNS